MLCFDYAGENNLKVSDIMNLQNIETSNRASAKTKFRPNSDCSCYCLMM